MRSQLKAFTVSSVSVAVAPGRISLSLTLLNGSLAKSPDGASNIGRASPRVSSDASAPAKAGLSLALLNRSLAKSPSGGSNIGRSSPGVGSNARAPGNAGLSLALANAAAVAGGLESPADGTGPSVLAVVAEAGVSHGGGDEASDDL